MIHSSPGAAFSLRGLIVSVQPHDDVGYPIIMEDLAVFAQFWGEQGEYRIWLALYEIPDDGEPVRVADHGLFSIRVRPGRFVEGLHMRLRKVPFPRAGLYEFRMGLDGGAEPLLTERLLLKE